MFIKLEALHKGIVYVNLNEITSIEHTLDGTMSVIRYTSGHSDIVKMNQLELIQQVKSMLGQYQSIKF